MRVTFLLIGAVAALSMPDVAESQATATPSGTPSRTDASQIVGEEGAQGLAMDQAQMPGDRQPVDQVGAIRQPLPPDQLSRESGLNPGAVQMSGRADSRGTTQVTTAARSAAAPEALSHPRDGRTPVVARIGGSDRCDPGQPSESRPSAADCARAVEANAEKFRNEPARPLSPEARLLVEQQQQRTGDPVATAARRLATNSADSESRDDQAIASVVLAQTQTDSPADNDEEDAAANSELGAIVDAVVAGATVTPR